MRKYISYALILATLALCSCTTMQYDANQTIEAEKVLKLQNKVQRRYNEVALLLTTEQKASIKAGSPIFTDDEWATLTEFNDDVDTIMAYMEAITSSADLMENVLEVQTMWAKIKMSYDNVREVVLAKQSFLSESKRVKLNVFDQLVQEDSKTIDALLEDPDFEKMTQILSLSSEVLDNSFSILKLLGVSLSAIQ